MSLEAYYRPFRLYRVTDGASAMDTPTETLVGTYLGFIQPVSGGEASRFSKTGEEYTHRLYTGVKTPARFGDIVRFGDAQWSVVFAEQAQGISSVGHHKEVELKYYV